LNRRVPCLTGVLIVRIVNLYFTFGQIRRQKAGYTSGEATSYLHQASTSRSSCISSDVTVPGGAMKHCSHRMGLAVRAIAKPASSAPNGFET
ncbi:MAG: hypothetical protein WB630_09325, partial [Candidatus Acidiferrales bacterium]